MSKGITFFVIFFGTNIFLDDQTFTHIVPTLEWLIRIMKALLNNTICTYIHIIAVYFKTEINGNLTFFRLLAQRGNSFLPIRGRKCQEDWYRCIGKWCNWRRHSFACIYISRWRCSIWKCTSRYVWNIKPLSFHYFEITIASAIYNIILNIELWIFFWILENCLWCLTSMS